MKTLNSIIREFNELYKTLVDERGITESAVAIIEMYDSFGVNEELKLIKKIDYLELLRGYIIKCQDNEKYINDELESKKDELTNDIASLYSELSNLSKDRSDITIS